MYGFINLKNQKISDNNLYVDLKADYLPSKFKFAKSTKVYRRRKIYKLKYSSSPAVTFLYTYSIFLPNIQYFLAVLVEALRR